MTNLLARLIAPIMLTLALSAQAGDPQPDAKYPPAAAEVVIESHGARLPGLMYLADGPGPHPTVLLLHGIPGNERNLDIAQELRRAGFNTLFFSYRGAWGSEGEYSVPHLAEDALAALAFLREEGRAARLRVDADRLALLGHSLGGYTALAAASRDSELPCVATMAAADLSVYADGIRAGRPEALDFLAYADSLFMLRGLSGDSMRRDLLDTAREQLDVKGFGPALAGKSVLLVAAASDQVTPPALMHEPVVAAYRGVDGLRLSSHVLTGDHSFSWSRLELTRLIRDWMLAECR